MREQLLTQSQDLERPSPRKSSSIVTSALAEQLKDKLVALVMWIRQMQRQLRFRDSFNTYASRKLSCRENWTQLKTQTPVKCHSHKSLQALVLEASKRGQSWTKNSRSKSRKTMVKSYSTRFMEMSRCQSTRTRSKSTVARSSTNRKILSRVILVDNRNIEDGHNSQKRRTKPMLKEIRAQLWMSSCDSKTKWPHKE